MFSSDIFRKFLRDLLVNLNFPDGALTLFVHEEGNVHDETMNCENMDHITLMKHMLTQQNIDDFGLKFFFENC